MPDNLFVFEWDELKNEQNIKKHHISFEEAKFVFNDKNRIELYDITHSSSEDRFIVIGVVDSVLYVVYTERNERIRLISARRANTAERNWYYDSFNNIK